MAMNDLKDSKIYIVMDKICKLYEEDGYRKTFMKNEFKEKDALNEILKELKELKYVKIRKNKFTIKNLGIRYLKNLLNECDNMYNTKRISVITFLVSSEIALIAVFVSLGAYIHADPWIVYLFMTLAVILIGYYLRKF